MTIHLNAPYKIIPGKQKGYASHYRIPAESALVVPLKQLDDDVLCEVRWRSHTGELMLLDNAVFATDNLVPINEMMDQFLFHLWRDNYKSESRKQ